jgi:2'-5' RNA ligase
MTHDPRAGTRALRNHWTWRPDWRHDRPCLWWYLTFGYQAEVVGLSERLAAAVKDRRTVDVVPPRWLHLTLREVGYVDEVSPEDVDEAARVARTRLAHVPAFELELGPPASLPGAVVLEARPAALVDQLRSCLPGRGPRAQNAEHGSSPTVLMPHVSVAYVNSDCPEPLVMDRVPKDAAPVRAQVDRVVLAVVTRHQRRYQWTVAHDVPLAGGSASGPHSRDRTSG